MVLVTYIKKGSQRHFSYRRPGTWMPKPGSPGGWEGDVRAARCGFAFWKAAAALRPQRELGPSRCPTRALSWVYQRPCVSLLSHAGAGVRQGHPRFSLVAVSSANGNRRSSNGVGSGMSWRGAPAGIHAPLSTTGPAVSLSGCNSGERPGTRESLCCLDTAPRSRPGPECG